MVKIAYFSAEYSVTDSLPIYAGGLGILAGDIVLEAGAEDLDFHAFGLVYHQAFTEGDKDKRSINDRLISEGFYKISDKQDSPKTLKIQIGTEQIAVQFWRKQYNKTTLTLLDTNIQENPPRWRKISQRLYDNEWPVMWYQQLVLGFGSVQLMESEGLEPDIYHLNEGHCAMVGVAVALRHHRLHPELGFEQSIDAVRPKLVATKHTIMHGAGLTLDRATLEATLGPVLKENGSNIDELIGISSEDKQYLFTTRLLLKMACRKCGVSRIHVQMESRVHPGSPLFPITNGIFLPRWRAQSLDGEPLKYSDSQLWEAHCSSRRELIAYVEAETKLKLDNERMTVVWARRMTAYKRPDLLISDIKRLSEIARRADRPIQFIIAGRAHPADTRGVEIMNRIIDAATKSPELSSIMAYLPNYNPFTARLLVQGADVWLNTPLRGMEACGTSGMKASLNGALQLSTSDGWVNEVDVDSIGWAIADDNSAASMYDLLEQQVAPTFYARDAMGHGIPLDWIKKMRAAIGLVESEFTAGRMLDDYYGQLYALPKVERGSLLEAEKML